MEKCLLTIAILLTIQGFTPCHAEQPKVSLQNENVKILDLLSKLCPDQTVTLAKSGCCSHHGGVCGCSGGRQLCCDGSLSPSCLCNSNAEIYIAD